MFTYFLFFFYLLVGIMLLHFIVRRYKFPFTIYHTVSIVIFKIFMGCLYGYVFLHYYGGDDTWEHFNESKAETDLLLQHPSQFLQAFSFSDAMVRVNNNFGKAILYFGYHFENRFMEKGLGVLNILSRKNYYIDVLLFEFLVIAGPLLLFRLLSRDFPKKTGVHFILIFFIPSVIFWCSGIRAEALILLFMMLIIYPVQAYARMSSLRYIVVILIGMAGFLFFRFQYLLVFLPAMLAYYISLRKQESGPVYFNRIYGVVMLIFGASLFLPAVYQLSRPIIYSQQGFFLLKGNTRYELDTLKPGPVSMIRVFPQAVANSMLRPYPWEGKSLLQSLSAVDVILIIAGLIYFLLWPERKKQISHPIFWLFLFYSISQMISIGYAVPFPGAIVRYRCIPFLLLILFLYSGNPYLEQKIRYRVFKLH